MKLCECGCGKQSPMATKTDALHGHVKGQPQRFILGHSRVRHGMHGTPEYTAFQNAKKRCMNPKHPRWPDYGGRGIKFLWKSFEQFFAELGPRPKGKTLDRIENNGNYEPGNCRWSTPKTQRLNQRVFA